MGCNEIVFARRVNALTVADPPRPAFLSMLNEAQTLPQAAADGGYQAWLYCQTAAAGQAAPVAELDLEVMKYRFEPGRFIREKLKWNPWNGTEDHPGQQQVVDAYALALRQQHERRDFENGKVPASELKYWEPGQVIQNWISVDGGHSFGKTTMAAGMALHFFTNFRPSIIYCFAPTSEQINDLLFKEIRTQHEGKGLIGKVLDGDPRINYRPNHFVKGKATNNSKGAGTERAQGQHGEYLMFVVDEAEGVPDFIFKAIGSMASGGICIVLVLRNPRTTVCQAHKIRRMATTAAFRISSIDHPNVLQDREIIPGAVRRQYVLDLLEECEVVNEHAPDDYTFELPWQPEVVYRPSLEFLWRVMGIASAKGTDDTFCPPGRYEAACRREPYDGDDPEEAFIGVDAARYGNDKGTIYIRHAGTVWKEDEVAKQDSFEYYLRVKKACLKLMALGVKRVHIRADAGGGYGNFVDLVKHDADLSDTKKLKELKIFEVYFNTPSREPEKYSNIVTHLYAYAAEALKVLRIKGASPRLERDLCERKYKYVIKTAGGKTRLDVKELVSKEKFKDDHNGESPDDGDGFVLACGGKALFVDVAPVAAPPPMTAASAWDMNADIDDQDD